MRTKRGNEIHLPLVIFFLVLLISFHTSTIGLAGQLQEANDAAASNTKGLELFRSGKFEEAANAYKQAIKLKQDYPEAH